MAYKLVPTEKKKRVHFKSLALLKQARLTSEFLTEVQMSVAEKFHSRSTTSRHFLSLTVCAYGASNIWWPHYRGEI